MIETTINNDLTITQEPKLIIHSNVNKILDTDSEQQQNTDITPKSSVCSNLCNNFFSLFKKDENNKKNFNNSSAETTTTEKIINKIFLENSISSSNTSCDSIDISFFQRQNQILEEHKNKRKILPDYKNSYTGSLSNHSSNDYETYRTNFTTLDNVVDNNNNGENKSKDTIDEVIKDLNINLSQISTNFDSLSLELKMSENNTSASQSDVSLDLQS
jgi:hypothetical protein